MTIIDLIHRDNSQVSYDLFNFPDGEPHFRFTQEIPRKEYFIVKTRITNPSDLFVLLQVCDILDRHDVLYQIDIYYLMSMRMDRVISFSEAFSLKITLRSLLATKAKDIKILSPHSERPLEESSRIKYLFKDFTLDFIRQYQQNTTICAPDMGMASKLTNPTEAVVFKKKRDFTTNQIVEYELLISQEHVSQTILVVDDLLDTGGTAVKAFNALKERFPESKINYFAVHAVNKDGLERVSKYFNHVFITDSFKDWEIEQENVSVIRITNQTT